MACLSTCHSDLVFTIVEGSNQGKSLPIKTQKCILAFNDVAGINHQTRCAIFRGEAGVTLRNLDSRVMVNGELKPLHWLQTGDRIEFPNSVLLEVAQLGSVGSELANTEPAGPFPKTLAPLSAEAESPETLFPQESEPRLESTFHQEVNFESTSTNPVDSVNSFQSDAQSVDLSSTDVSTDGFSELFKSVESIAETTSDSSEEFHESDYLFESSLEDRVPSSVENRFHEIEERLNQLADQISSLVTLASCGKFSSSVLPEAEWEKQIASSATDSMDVGQGGFAANEANDATNTSATASATTPSRFNVAAFGPEPIIEDSVPDPKHSDFHQSKDSSVAWQVTDSSDDPIFDSTGLSEDPFLVPSRRAAEETPTPEFTSESKPFTAAGASESPSFDPELSQLLKSLIQAEQSESALAAQTESVFEEEPIPHDPQALDPSANAPSSSQWFGAPVELSPATDLAAKFSAFGSSDQETSPEPQSTAATSLNKFDEAPVKRAPSSVEDEIDAMLNRLFEKTNQSSGATPKTPESRMAPENSESVSRFNEVPSVLDNLTRQNADSDPAQSYANMKFGYELEPLKNMDHVTPMESDSGAQWLTPTADAAPASISNPTPSDDRVAAPIAAGPGGDLPSVADLLNRLKQDGCWSDSAPAETTPSPNPPALPEVLIGNLVSQAAAQSSPEAPAATPKAPSAGPLAAEPAADSVEDYMTQLLARMNISPDAPSKPSTKNEQAQPSTGSSIPADPNQDSELMTEAEYIPRQRAAKPQSFDTMREIANSTARSAVADSDLDRKRARGLMQVVIAVGALIMAGYYLLFVSKAAADTAFFVGAICLLIAGGTGFLAFKTLQGVKGLSETLPGKKPE